MSRHRYQSSTLVPDYLRAGAGLALTGGPLLFAAPASPVVLVLGSLVGLFLLYGVRTAVRQMTCYELTEAGVTATGPFGASVSWNTLQGVQLRYFSTNRDRTAGWMQLKLVGSDGSLRLDSDITDFAHIAARAAIEAERRGLTLNEATRVNLSSLDARPEHVPGVASAHP